MSTETLPDKSMAAGTVGLTVGVALVVTLIVGILSLCEPRQAGSVTQ